MEIIASQMNRRTKDIKLTNKQLRLRKLLMYEVGVHMIQLYFDYFITYMSSIDIKYKSKRESKQKQS